jgi:hypothetical protein
VCLNPAPYAVSNSGLLEDVYELTIPGRSVEALRAIDSYVDGHQEAQGTPKADNDNKTVNQAPPAPRYTGNLSRDFCLFIIMADSPETNDSEGVY